MSRTSQCGGNRLQVIILCLKRSYEKIKIMLVRLSSMTRLHNTELCRMHNSDRDNRDNANETMGDGFDNPH